MNENIYANELKTKYLDAKKQFKHPNITGSLSYLKDNNLNFEKLKIEVEKLDFHLDLAKDINIEFWQNEWKRKPFFVFYNSTNDL